MAQRRRPSIEGQTGFIGDNSFQRSIPEVASNPSPRSEISTSSSSYGQAPRAQLQNTQVELHESSATLEASARASPADPHVEATEGSGVFDDEDKIQSQDSQTEDQLHDEFVDGQIRTYAASQESIQPLDAHFDNIDFQRENLDEAIRNFGTTQETDGTRFQIPGMRSNIRIRDWQLLGANAVLDAYKNPSLGGHLNADDFGLGKTWTTLTFLLKVSHVPVCT